MTTTTTRPTPADVRAERDPRRAFELAHQVPFGGVTVADVLAERRKNIARVLARRVAERIDHGRIGGFDAWSIPGWLVVGCELHPFAEWVTDAEAIDARHESPGLAEQTRALALRLIAEQQP